MSLRLLSVTLVLSILSMQASARSNDQSFTVISDVQFCSGGGIPLLMDLFIPTHRNRTPTPAVLWIHGGGWEKGDKNGHANAEFVAQAGFVVATLSYRLSGTAPFPAAVEDCKCAIRFLRANATKYGIAPDRIGVGGSSAGGHLAELLATAGSEAGLEGDGGWQGISSKVQAAVSYFGVSDLTAPFSSETVPVIVKFFHSTRDENPNVYREASPIFYVSKNAPPLLLVHGEEDHDVPFDQSVRMMRAYKRLRLSFEFIAVKNAGHDFQHMGDQPLSPSVEAIHRETIEFLIRYLVDSNQSKRERESNAK